MKKFVSLLIVLLLVFTMALTSLAEESTDPPATEGGATTEPEQGGEGGEGGDNTEPEKPEPKGEIVVSSADIAKIYKGDGTEGNFNGGSGMHNVFDGNFDDGLYMNTGGSYIIVDLNSALEGGYYVTTIRIGHVGNTKYTLSYSTSGGESYVTIADGVTTAGTVSYTVNEVVTHVKYVFDTTIGWTQSLKEIEVKGIDPAEIDCFHKNLTDWTPIAGSATCTERGKDVQECMDCGEKIYRESTTILPTGHAYVSEIIEQGKGLISCDDCDYELVINGEVDLMTLGGEKREGVLQFVNVSVTSTGNVDWGQNPGNMWDGGWTTGWGDYWYPATNDDVAEYILFEMGTEIDLTMLDIAVFNVPQTLEIYVYDREKNDFVLARSVQAYNEFIENEAAFRMEIDLAGISTTMVKIHLKGDSQIRICELHLYGTAKGATGIHRHNYTELVKVLVEQTCAVTGKSIYRCECGRERETYQVATGNHAYTILKETTLAPTCGDKGTGVYKCETCDGTQTLDIDPTGEHKFTVFVEITYKDGYSKDGEKVYKCEVCVAEEKTTMPALIVIDGYSIKNDGTAITCDFDIKVEILNQYEALTEKKVEFGIFITGAKMLAGAGGLLDENGALTSEKFTMSEMDEKYETMSVTVSSMPSDLSLVDTEFVMGMFITIDGETTLEQGDAYVSQILDGAFNTISVRKIAELTNEDGIFDNIIALPKKDEE